MNVRKVLILMPVLALLAGCAHAEEVPELIQPAAVVWDTASVMRGDVKSLAAYDAYVYAENQELSFSLSGYVDKLEVAAGQSVSEGDLLVSLDTSDIDKSIETCQNNITDTKEEYGFQAEQLSLDIEVAEVELQQLSDEEQIAQKNLDISALRQQLTYLEENRDNLLSSLRSTLSDLQEERESYFLYAPISDTITAVYVTGPGMGVSAYSAVVSVSDPNSLYLRYYGSKNLYNTTSQVSAFYNNTEYPVQLIEYTKAERTAIILSGGSAPARFTIPEALVSQLHIGQCVQIFVIASAAEDVLYVPINSLYIKNSATKEGYVYRMEEGLKVYTEVKFGLTTGSFAVITSSLEEGDTVYVKQ